MKDKKILKIGLVLLAVILIIVVGYFIYQSNRNQETGTTKNNNNNELSNDVVLDATYSNYGIEFKYPATFRQTKETLKENGFEAIDDGNGHRFQIQDEKIVESSDLKDKVDRLITDVMQDGTNYRTLLKEPEYITLPSGVKGYKIETVTRDNACQIIFITQKEENAYQFTFTMNEKSDYGDYIEIANEMFNSLKMN